jgi:hypothetical protein
MKPNADLINRLSNIDTRIIYAGFPLFDDLKETESYLRRLYTGSEPLRLRGIALYLAEEETLTFTKDNMLEAQDCVMRGFYSGIESPVKNVVDCVRDGYEKPEFFVSNHSFDLGWITYGKMAAHDLRDIFPLQKHLIYPGIMVYKEKGLVFDRRKARTLDSDSLKTVIVSEY